MEPVDLQHLKPLATAAYEGIAIYPNKMAEIVINEYAKEINSDIRKIRQSAGTGIAPTSIDPLIAKYASRYVDHLKTWLENGRAQYLYFREWRNRSLKVIARNIQRRLSSIKQATEKIKVRSRRQRSIGTGGRSPNRRH